MTAPADVPVIMRARLNELDGCWLEIHCGQCGHRVDYPLKLLAGQRGQFAQLGAILPRLACKRCKVPPAGVWLKETPNRSPNYGAPPGWSVQLVPYQVEEAKSIQAAAGVSPGGDRALVQRTGATVSAIR